MESKNLASKEKVETNQTKSAAKYEIIRADFFLEKIFLLIKLIKNTN